MTTPTRWVRSQATAPGRPLGRSRGRPQLCLLSGLPGTCPAAAGAQPSQGPRASPALQAWCQPEVRVCVKGQVARWGGPGPTAPHVSPQEAPRGCQEVPEGLRRAAAGPVVHRLPLEEGLPTLPGCCPLPRPPELPEEKMSCTPPLPGALRATGSTFQWGRGIRDTGAPEAGEGPTTQSASEETSLLH